MLKWLTISFVLLILFSGNVCAQCISTTNFSLLPSGNSYSEGDVINYTAEFDVLEEGNPVDNCIISDVVIRFFPPNDLPSDLNTPCNDPGGVVIYENLGVDIIPGEPPVVLDATVDPIMDYTVASNDSYHLSLLAHMCATYNTKHGETVFPASSVVVSTNSLSASDSDNDGVLNVEDNCPDAPNPNQVDSDGDGIGDACVVDNDSDGVLDDDDNCPNIANPGQEDADSNGVGDSCESSSSIPVLIFPADGATEVDNGRSDLRDSKDWIFSWSPVAGAERYNLFVMHTGSINPATNDLYIYDTTWDNREHNCTGWVDEPDRFDWYWRVRAYIDGQWGDWSEVRYFNVEPPNLDPQNTNCADTDNDTIRNVVDNCPTVANPDQLDVDENGVGDACE